MDVERLVKQMIREGEGVNIDFKTEISDADKIARNIVAFANSKGGLLVFGIEDKGQIIGVQPAQEQFAFEAAIKNHCNGPIDYEAKNIEISGIELWAVHVFENESKPVYHIDQKNNERIFIRIQDQCVEPPEFIEKLILNGTMDYMIYNSKFKEIKRNLLPEFEKSKNWDQTISCLENYSKFPLKLLTTLLFDGSLAPIDLTFRYFKKGAKPKIARYFRSVFRTF